MPVEAENFTNAPALHQLETHAINPIPILIGEPLAPLPSRVEQVGPGRNFLHADRTPEAIHRP